MGIGPGVAAGMFICAVIGKDQEPAVFGFAVRGNIPTTVTAGTEAAGKTGSNTVNNGKKSLQL